MSTKYITNNAYITSGYTISGVNRTISIGAAASIGGTGITSGTAAAYAIVNHGRVTGIDDGIYLRDGGSVANAAGALIEGSYGLQILGGTGAVSNAGSVIATGAKGIGVLIGTTGTVSNSGTASLISGGYGVDFTNGPGTVTNAGTIRGAYIGVALGLGGEVTNSGSSASIIGDDGVFILGFAGTVTNSGRIVGTYAGADNNGALFHGYGIELDGGGLVTNAAGATIAANGKFGVAIAIGVGGDVTNSGTIEAKGSLGKAVYLAGNGGVLYNESGGLIAGYTGISVTTGTIINAGSIDGTGRTGLGISLVSGLITNDKAGAIADGVSIDAGTINNFGLISVRKGDLPDIYVTTGIIDNAEGALILGQIGIESTPYNAGPVTVVNVGAIAAYVFGTGISLTDGGRVQNSGIIQGETGIDIVGSVTNTLSGLIQAGQYGIIIDGAQSSNDMLVNGGNIEATATSASGFELRWAGVYIRADVSQSFVDNESSGVISGSDGIVVGATASAVITNAGLIEARSGDAYGILFGPTEQTGTSAAIGTVTNSGIIEAVNGVGISLNQPDGAITNITNTSGGVIEGAVAGMVVDSLASLVNGGTVIATGTTSVGILEYINGLITNASSGVIQGATGIEIDSIDATISNAGTIASSAGTSGIAVEFEKTEDVLIDDAGSSFIGQVIGDNGTLELAGNSGTLTGLGSQFSGFGTVQVLAGAAWTLTGTNVVASGTSSSLSDQGTLTLQGTDTIAGTVSGSGTLVLDGNETIEAGATLSVGDFVMERGTALFDASLTYSGDFTVSGGNINANKHTVALNGTAGLDGGQLSGDGFLAVHGPTSLVAFTVDTGSVLQVWGTTTDTGTLTLGDASGTSGRLNIEQTGVFVISGGVAIAKGGVGQFYNEGQFEKVSGTGISVIAPAIVNTGTVSVTAGTLDLAGALTGAGEATIGAKGTLKLDGSVGAAETISFAASTGGVLVLDNPASGGLGFGATVDGFTGSNEIDFAGFAFSGGPKLKWTQNGNEGTLTVTDGSITASILLFGQYVQSGFKPAQDSGTGTAITYTPPPQAELAVSHR